MKSEKRDGKYADVNQALKSIPVEPYFPIVGIGASAGGLAAFEAFFSGMPVDKDPDMAFVLVQHLAPDHKSILTELIRRYTRMQVFEVEDGMIVQPNCAYIIPPNYDMAFINGSLQLLEPSAPRGQRLPIDFFFRSLAEDQHEQAIGIILSGTGSDGTLGIRAIKGENGMVMAQKAVSTEFNGMPLSAIGTGLVDYELPPAEMPNQLISYVSHAFNKSAHHSMPKTPTTENALKKIFFLLRAQTSHDFSMYKPNTIQRRIERRLAVNQIETMDEYVKYLQQTPNELESLFHDLLIGVTKFFRDPEAFTKLEDEVIPKIFSGKTENDAIRIWVPGCSSGEESYSIAILLAEWQERMKQNHKVQIFATDIDNHAIAIARSGIYPASIAADISAERLSKFFSIEPGNSYRIHKKIRDMLIFSEQDMIKDPPFSRLDLISCRNLLIYMGSDLQKKILSLFHYALRPGGFLFLGSSETLGEFAHLYHVLDRKYRLFQRKEDFLGDQPLRMSSYVQQITGIDGTYKPAEQKAAIVIQQLEPTPVRVLTEQALLRLVAPAAALVTAKGDILYLHGRTGLFLEPTPGESGKNNILKMAREGLQHTLTTALHQAAKSKEIVRKPGVRVKTNGDYTTINLMIQPILAPNEYNQNLTRKKSANNNSEMVYLVVLEIAKSTEIKSQRSGIADAASNTEMDILVTALKQDLIAKEEYLQSSNEELETANEELKSSNEEMQSVNEELQSTNEELETSKEELQSVNEELTTVNSELQTKVADLSMVNNDMNNLLAGTGIATIFVDHSQHILRFTPSATRIINLILSDIGRPVNHILTNLVNYDTLSFDIQVVLDSLIAKEVEVQTNEGAWYTMRILPYRTLENVIEGAVLTFVEITDRKNAEQQKESVLETLQETQARLKLALEVAGAGTWDWDILTNEYIWSDELWALYGLPHLSCKPSQDAWMETIHPEDRKRVEEVMSAAVHNGNDLKLEWRVVHPDGKEHQLLMRGWAQLNKQGEIIRYIGVVFDITNNHNIGEENEQ